MEKDLNVDSDHVIVDRKDWEEAHEFFRHAKEFTKNFTMPMKDLIQDYSKFIMELTELSTKLTDDILKKNGIESVQLIAEKTMAPRLSIRYSKGGKKSCAFINEPKKMIEFLKELK